MEQKITRKIFIACSSAPKARETAIEIKQSILNYQTEIKSLKFLLEPVIWREDKSLQKASTLLHSIISIPKNFNYGIFLFSDEDDINLRLSNNVVLELGLFLAQEDGLEKSFTLQPDHINLQLPSDLSGIMSKKIPFGLVSNNALKRHKLNEAIHIIIEKIEDYEHEIEKKSREIYLNGIHLIKEELLHQRTSPEKKAKTVLTALGKLVDIKAKAMHQTSDEVLHDILIWTRNLIDISETSELLDLQNNHLKEVWVFSELPIEVSHSKYPDLQKSLKEKVCSNLKKGVKYTYFVDSKKVKEAIQNEFKNYGNNISIYLVEPSMIITHFAFHFFKNGSHKVFQNVVRNNIIESLLHLEDSDAKKIVDKLKNIKKDYTSTSESGFTIFNRG